VAVVGRRSKATREGFFWLNFVTTKQKEFFG
jgi:hypothetical protein